MNEPASHVPFHRYIRGALGPDPNGPPDGELLRRFVANADHGAFELIVWRHAAMVQRICRGILRDHHAAEDATQAVFLTLARCAGSIESHKAIVGWLHLVARRIAIRAARRNSKRQSFSAPNLSEMPDGNTPVDADADTMALIHDEVARLPEKYRLPVLLCYFEGLSQAEAAKRLGWPVGSLSSRMGRAKEQLQRRLTRRGITVPVAAVAAMIASDHPPASTLAFVEITSNAATAFAAGRYSQLGVSSSVQELAREAIQGMFVDRVKWLVGTMLICTITSLVGAHALGAFSTPDVALPGSSSSSIPQNSTGDATKQVEVVAPLPIQPKKLSEKEIADWGKMGAVHGKISFNGPDELLRFNPLRIDAYKNLTRSKFVKDSQKLETESYPGFQIPLASTAARNLGDLPKVNAPFALDLRELQPTDSDLKGILKKNELITLSIFGDSFTNEFLKEIGSQKSMKILEIGGSKVDDDGVRELARLPELTDLFLNCPKLTDNGVASLAKMKKLTSLTIASEKLGDAALHHLCSLRNLKQLFIVGPIEDSGLKPLEKMDKLEFLAIHSRLIRGSGLVHVAKLTGLVRLDLSCANLQQEELATLCSLKSLKCLKFMCEKQADKAVDCLTKLKELDRIDLMNSDLTDAGLEKFAAFEHLERLSIFSKSIYGSRFKSLAALSNLKELQLYCYGDEFTVSLDGISALGQLKKLDYFCFHCNTIQDESMKHLAALENISEIEINARSHTFKADAIKPLKGLKKLKILDLHSNIDLEALNELIALKGLTRLSFTCEAMNDEKLGELASLVDLASLSISSRKVTADGIRNLRDKLPKCSIRRGKKWKLDILNDAKND